MTKSDFGQWQKSDSGQWQKSDSGQCQIVQAAVAVNSRNPILSSRIFLLMNLKQNK